MREEQNMQREGGDLRTTATSCVKRSLGSGIGTARMTSSTSPARQNGEGESKTTLLGVTGGFPPQIGNPSEDTASSSLSEHQKKLLAGLGVLSSGQLQRRVMSVGLLADSRRQDILPARLVTHKQVTTSPSSFSPTFIQPQPVNQSQNKDLKMVLNTFDPSKYGARNKKQRGKASHGFVKPLPSGVANPDLTSTPEHARPRSSVTPSTISEVPNHAVSLLTHTTETSNATKSTESKVLKSKSSNKLMIPGFDPSKYGMPSATSNRSPAQEDASVKADTKANTVNLHSLYPATSTAITSLSQRQNSTSIESTTHCLQKPIEHAGTTTLPIRMAKEDSNSSDLQSPTTSKSEVASPAPNPRYSTVPRQLSSNKTLASSLLSSEKPMSSEERLKQVQQIALREIGSRNRHKGDAPETTSVRDLRIARDTAYSQSLATATSTTKQSPVAFASSHDTSQTVQLRRGPDASKAYSATPAALPGMSKESRLKQVQDASLREIGMRNRGDKRDPETTSLVDLNLARTPAKQNTYESAAYTRPLAPVHAAASGRPERAFAHTNTHQLSGEEGRPRLTNSVVSTTSRKTARKPKWCTNEELRAEPNLETGSNAWGSDIASNASVASSDSLRPMQFHGRLFNGPPAGDNDEVTALVGWDGKMQPPPVDWNCRPRFNNNSPAFKNGFHNWFAAAASECYEVIDKTPMFKTIPYHLVSNVEWHADGLAMTRRDFTLNAHNLSKYGYDTDSADIAKYAEEVTPDDYEDWAKLDLRDADNMKYKDETTDQLVKNWLIHQEKSKKTISLAVLPGHKPTRESKAPKPEPNPNEPSINIYLRPAVKGDMGQLTELYNWWVENSARPSEVRPVDTSDMRLRFDNTKEDRLPFIVAILKGKKDVQRNYYTGVKVEQVVGFACANGLTAADYVEHIAAELEIYVHHKYLRQGIGKCLLDRHMCATDRGHMERGGYPFHCDPAERHWYEVGGARDLHKLMFVARQHSRAKKDCPEELEVTTWMKKWLVKEWDFELEACLKQAGAKGGRFLDLTYFTKFGKWLPEDGKVPDPEPKDHKRH